VRFAARSAVLSLSLYLSWFVYTYQWQLDPASMLMHVCFVVPDVHLCSNPVAYRFEELAMLPVVRSMVPSSGWTEGGTLVTVSGSGFQSRGVLTFETGTGLVVGECRWNDTGNPTNYTSTSIWCV
jgi:hypothetical protein